MNTRRITVCLFFLILWIAPAAKTADPAAHNAPATRPDCADTSFCTWLKQMADTAPLFRLSPELESLTLHQWVKEHGKNTVILIVDRLWPDSFAQLIPFEKLVQDNPGYNVRYCVIFLHRRPKEFLNHITGIRQADYDRFTASLTSFSHKELNFQKPLIVFIDTNLDVLSYIQEYCNYKCLKEYLNVFSSPGPLILKGDNE